MLQLQLICIQIPRFPLSIWEEYVVHEQGIFVLIDQIWVRGLKQTWISVSEKPQIDRWLIYFVKWLLLFFLSFFLFLSLSLSFFNFICMSVYAWVFFCAVANRALGLGPKLGPRLQCGRYGCLVLDLVLRNAQHTCVSGIRRETDYFHEELESLWEKSNFGLSYGQGDDTLR